MGKGGEQKTTVELPKEIQEAAKANQAYAEQVSKIPYIPNFGLQFAAFTPQQQAAFNNTSGAASAFGMGSAGNKTGLPAPSNVGGFSGYSTQPLYENSMSKVSPDLLQYINSMFFGGGQASANQGSQPTYTQSGGGTTQSAVDWLNRKSNNSAQRPIWK